MTKEQLQEKIGKFENWLMQRHEFMQHGKPVEMKETYQGLRCPLCKGTAYLAWVEGVYNVSLNGNASTPEKQIIYIKCKDCGLTRQFDPLLMKEV